MLVVVHNCGKTKRVSRLQEIISTPSQQKCVHGCRVFMAPTMATTWHLPSPSSRVQPIFIHQFTFEDVEFGKPKSHTLEIRNVGQVRAHSVIDQADIHVWKGHPAASSRAASLSTRLHFVLTMLTCSRTSVTSVYLRSYLQYMQIGWSASVRYVNIFIPLRHVCLSAI